MKGYIVNIEEETLNNSDYRRVLYTAKNCQLVLMSLKPGEEIGEEMHHLDQFFRFEAGFARVILDGVAHELVANHVVIVPAGTKHNIINRGNIDLKLYTLYAPPQHKDGIVEHSKADEVEEHFDGVTTE